MNNKEIFEKRVAIETAIEDVMKSYLTDDFFDDVDKNKIDERRQSLVNVMTGANMRDIIIDRDGDVIAYEICDDDSIEGDPLAYAYVAMMYAGIDERPIVIRRERVPVDDEMDKAGYYINWDDESYEAHGIFSLFDSGKYAEPCDLLYDQLVRLVMMLLVKVMPTEKMVGIFKDMSLKAKAAFLKHPELMEMCRDNELKMIVMRFFWEHFKTTDTTDRRL